MATFEVEVESTVEPDMIELMPDIVRIDRRKGEDQYTNPIFGPPTYYQARVEAKPKVLQSITGQILISSGRVILSIPDKLSLFDKITLPDGTSPTILGIQASPDTNGRYWVEISI